MRSSALLLASVLVGFCESARAASEPLAQETVETRAARNSQAKPERQYEPPRHRHERGHSGPKQGQSGAQARPGEGSGGPRRGGDDARADRRANGRENEIETEHMFGFTAGSDTHEKGTKEAELDTVGRFGKRDGSYKAISKKLEFSYGVTDDLTVGLGFFADYHRVRGVTGFEDVKGFNFNGLGGELRWRLLRRGPSTPGVTLQIEPSVQRVDEVSGLRGTRLGAENMLILDRELIPERLFAAFNLIYELERVRENGSPEWESESKVGIAAAASVQVVPKLFLGGELRYLRAYEGLLPCTFLGDAVFVGPTLFWSFASNAFISAAWNVQVAGHEAGNPLRLDLTNFERHHARVKVGVEF